MSGFSSASDSFKRLFRMSTKRKQRVVVPLTIEPDTLQQQQYQRQAFEAEAMSAYVDAALVIYHRQYRAMEVRQVGAKYVFHRV